jgi:uncharacterized protein (DUF983 family)
MVVGTTSEKSNQDEPRSMVSAMLNGARCKCPACGKGPIFNGLLSVTPKCSECGEDLSHQRADDLPPYLNIFLTGHVIVGIILLLIDKEIMPIWALTVGTILVALVFSVLIMRPLKGLVVGSQWAMRMHGFGGHED